MTRFLSPLFWFFLTWWGVFLLAALDSSLVFFIPFGIDAIVVYLAARDRELFWLYPLLATLGSTAGAAVTYAIGMKAGEAGLGRLVAKRRLERLRKRVRKTGAAALASSAILPPPFPLTGFVLMSGALRVSPWRFISVFAGVRLVRFGSEAGLARLYGRRVLDVMDAPVFQWVIGGFIVLAVGGTAVSLAMMWRRTRH